MRPTESSRLRFAYADPPYPGQAERLYGEHRDYAGEVNYEDLIGRLEAGYDGWALSCGVRDLQTVLPLCPRPEQSPKRRRSYVDGTGVRVLSWVKPMTPLKPKVSVQYGWEPIILRGGRRRSIHDGLLNDWIACSPVNWRKEPHGVPGMKPEALCMWIFRALGAAAGDSFEDLYPGSGNVTRAWANYIAQPPLYFGGRLENEPLEGVA